MKKALIDTQASVQHIASWTTKLPISPIYETYPNSCRVCEVADTTFDVYPTLFWVGCDDNVVADQFWYDKSESKIKPIVNAEMPEPIQPEGEGLNQF